MTIAKSTTTTRMITIALRQRRAVSGLSSRKRDGSAMCLSSSVAPRGCPGWLVTGGVGGYQGHRQAVAFAESLEQRGDHVLDPLQAFRVGRLGSKRQQSGIGVERASPPAEAHPPVVVRPFDVQIHVGALRRLVFEMFAEVDEVAAGALGLDAGLGDQHLFLTVIHVRQAMGAGAAAKRHAGGTSLSPFCWDGSSARAIPSWSRGDTLVVVMSTSTAPRLFATRPSSGTLFDVGIAAAALAGSLALLQHGGIGPSRPG